ncbi:MAG: hypothetical protein COA68_17715 [Oceanobacter sp.]|nr:MAG: hypothetical protein COA68_17715 [Oceanobacter sp.]
MKASRWFMKPDLTIEKHVYFPKNDKGIDFFVGDIHGELRKLMLLLKKINFNFSKDRLFATGDLIDRGEDSLECLKLTNKKWFFSVLGNHEQFLLEAEDNHAYKKMVWEKNGGRWFYELCDEDKQISKQLANDNLCLSLTVNTLRGDVGVIHGEYPFQFWPIKDGSPLNEQSIRKILWGRDIVKAKLENYTKGVELIISGHTSIETPILLGNQVFVDTGCGYSPRKNLYTPHLTICEVKGKSLKFYRSDEQVKEIPF